MKISNSIKGGENKSVSCIYDEKMENKKEKFKLTITFNPDGVIHPVLKLMKECSETILFGLKLCEATETLPKELTSEDMFMKIQFGEPDNNIENQKLKYKDWLITKGFEDLIKGINLSLIEALFFVSVFHSKNKNELVNFKEIEGKLTRIRAMANKKPLPILLSKITPHLLVPLLYEKEILTMNRVRRCLVHRNGVVSKEDINDTEMHVLRLHWLRLKIIYEDKGKAIELKREDITKENIMTYLKIEPMDQTFNLGEKISFNYRQFNEFLTTGYWFAMDLAKKLPRIEDVTATSPV
jgi:hypothetical protein